MRQSAWAAAKAADYEWTRDAVEAVGSFPGSGV